MIALGIDFDELKRVDTREVARRLGLELNRQGKTRCFLHAADSNPSLQVYADGWKCFGCGQHGDGIDLIAKYLNLSNLEAANWMQKEFNMQPGKPDYGKFEREHIYPGGNLKKVIHRRGDGSKYGFWQRFDGGRWINGRDKGIPPLYAADSLPDHLFIVEGEKDVDRLNKNGKAAVSLPDGSGSKWYSEYADTFNERHVYIIQDNDTAGKKYAQMVAENLHGVASTVRVLDLTAIWAELPEKGDTSALLDHLGDNAGIVAILDLAMKTPEWEPTIDDPFLACFKTLDSFEEETASWLVPGWIPEGQITLLAADGGIGKTTLWVDLITALSSGGRCILDPPDHTRKPAKVAFLTTEDSVRKKLKKKLRLAGANEKNVLTPDFLADKNGVLRDLKFGRPDMARFIRHYKPALCVFDPVQGFIPPDVNMGSRNAMRDCMAPLIALGEETGTTFLVVCHTNKRKGAFGRDRIADSADLWDISRSVLMAGYTEDQGIRYLSNEKNNYEQLQETILFSIDDNGQVRDEGKTWKRDREYTQEAAFNVAAPKREDCKEWLLKELDESGGAVPSKELEDKAKLAGYSFRTLRRAKDELKQSGEVRYFHTGGNEERVWHIQRTNAFIELPDGTPTPFTV